MLTPEDVLGARTLEVERAVVKRDPQSSRLIRYGARNMRERGRMNDVMMV
jgi:hypothetical protein